MHSSNYQPPNIFQFQSSAYIPFSFLHCSKLWLRYGMAFLLLLKYALTINHLSFKFHTNWLSCHIDHCCLRPSLHHQLNIKKINCFSSLTVIEYKTNWSFLCQVSNKPNLCWHFHCVCSNSIVSQICWVYCNDLWFWLRISGQGGYQAGVLIEYHYSWHFVVWLAREDIAFRLNINWRERFKRVIDFCWKGMI